MQTEAVLSSAAACACRPSLLTQLGRHRRLLGGFALVLLAAGLAWQWSWLIAIGVAPLLISAGPCLAMCALGLCMHRAGGRTSNAAQDGPTVRLTSERTLPQQES